jgi:tetratricopeptide (TPR) repeat protein
MYLRGSKLDMTKKRKKRKRPNYWRIAGLLMLIGFFVYVNEVIVPATPPLFIPTPTSTRPPESYITDAENLLAEGKMVPAIQVYRQAIEADPTSAGNYITIARLQVFTGDYEEAATNAENALLLSPNNSMAYAVRGWALGFLEDYLNGEAALIKSIELDPNNGFAYAYYAELLIQEYNAGQGDLTTLDRAIDASKIAVSLNPTAIETYRARGFVLEVTGNYKEAIQAFESAVAINENIADMHLALGRNYRYLQEYALAVEEFNRANALNPADPEPDMLISRTYASVGEYAKAIQYAEQSVKDVPTDPWLWGNLGTMYYRNRQYNSAVDAFRLAIYGGNTQDADEVEGLSLDYGRIAEYYYMFGLSLARIGECGEGLKISQTLLQGVPDDEISVYNAQEIINICQQLLIVGTPTPDILLTEILETDTPSP